MTDPARSSVAFLLQGSAGFEGLALGLPVACHLLCPPGASLSRAGGGLTSEKRNEILTYRLGEVHCVRWE